MTADPRPLVAVLFGGMSGEHQISCATAGGVLGAIDEEKWQAFAIGITPDGQWVPMPSDPLAYVLGDDGGYTVEAGDLRVAILPGSPRLIQFEVDDGGHPVPETVRTIGDIDVLFPLLHGPYGEDGTVQGLLELSKVRYVGCGVASSAVCQDKYLTKTVLGAAGIDVGEWVAFTQRDWLGDQQEWEAQVAALGFPVFVKPCRAGSSLGVSRVDAPADRAAALDEAMRHDPRVIVEAACPGREVECGVLGTADGSLSASAIGEIRVLTEGFYDYESKYFAPQAVQLDCPADLPEDVARAIQKIALVAFEAVEGEGISRIDFFYNEESGRIVLNEINTLPGFTPGSLYPVMFDRVGITYPELVSALLEEAAARPVGLR